MARQQNHHVHRRAFVIGALTLANGMRATAQQPFPSRPIRIILGYPPGSSGDALARVLILGMSEQLGVPVILENRPGASGSLGAMAVARSTADGYTLLYGLQDSQVMFPLLKRNSPYNPETDFTPLGKVAELGLVLVAHPSTKITTVAQLVKAAKENPGVLKFASPGTGSLTRLTIEMVAQRTGTKFLHIPYQGGGPALTGVLRGDVDFTVFSETLLVPHIKTGTLSPLAVTTEKRSKQLPAVPTMAEAGVPDLVTTAWYGIYGPIGMPEPVTKRLVEAMATVASSQAYGQQISMLGGEATPVSREGFSRFQKAELLKYKNIIERGAIPIED